MNKQELIEKIKLSPLSDERRQKILSLLEQNDLTFDIKEQIKDIIQEDIDSDTSVQFSAEDKKEIDAATAQAAKELDGVEMELGKDMDFVEKEMNNLETIVADLDKTVDQDQVEAIRADIQS